MDRIINENLDAVRRHIRELQHLVDQQGMIELQALIFKFNAINQEGDVRGEAVEGLMKETGSLLLAFRRRGKRKRDKDTKETKKRQKPLPRDRLSVLPTVLSRHVASFLPSKDVFELRQSNRSLRGDLEAKQPNVWEHGLVTGLAGLSVGGGLVFKVVGECPFYAKSLKIEDGIRYCSMEFKIIMPDDVASVLYDPSNFAIKQDDVAAILQDLSYRNLDAYQQESLMEFLIRTEIDDTIFIREEENYLPLDVYYKVLEKRVIGPYPSDLDRTRMVRLAHTRFGMKGASLILMSRKVGHLMDSGSHPMGYLVNQLPNDSQVSNFWDSLADEHQQRLFDASFNLGQELSEDDQGNSSEDDYY